MKMLVSSFKALRGLGLGHLKDCLLSYVTAKELKSQGILLADLPIKVGLFGGSLTIKSQPPQGPLTDSFQGAAADSFI